jgi:hypothetical protein
MTLGVEGGQGAGEQLGVDEAEGEDVGLLGELVGGGPGFLDVADQLRGVVVHGPDDLAGRGWLAGQVGQLPGPLAPVADHGAAGAVGVVSRLTPWRRNTPSMVERAMPKW